MKIGLGGMPGGGKSTVFGALTGIAVETGYAAAAGKANVGVVKVPDPRVDALAALYSPKKTIYAETSFTDLAATGATKGIDRATLNAMRDVDALCQVLRGFPSWVVTVEGHCDERGTAEYNLALGDGRALVARRYLVELGVDEDRVRTVSYGKEFPFDPGHDESAWSENRRAHFVITAK